MTIITKPITEKKADKLDVPLVENDQLAGTVSSNDTPSTAIEDGRCAFVYFFR